MGLTQSKISNAGSVTSLAVSFDSLPAVGARIVVAVAVWPQDQGNNLTCTDNQGHTYTSRWGVSGGGNTNGYACWDVVVTTSSGTFTVTVAGMETGGDLTVGLVELSGAGSFEEVVFDLNSAGGTTASKSITTDGADREVIGVMTHDWANNPADVTENNGFALVVEQTNNNTAAALQIARKAVASAGTETASWTWNDAGTHSSTVGVLAYYGSSGPGPSSDTGTATDSASLSVTVSSSDSAAETDAGSTPNTPISSSDTVAAVDIARLHAVTAPRVYVVTQAVASGSTGPVTITAPSANDGDLLLIHVHQRTNNATLSISGAGGQTWTSGTKRTQSTTNTSQTFWAKKSGTLTNVTVAGTTTASESMIARMVVIRGNHQDIAAILDLAESGAGFAAPSTPFDRTATGQTTVSPGAMTLVFFGSQDDNQWVVQTSGWTAVAAVTQNTGGNDNSEYAVYKEMPVAGATGDVVARQNTVGGDAGTYHVITIKPAPLSWDLVTAWDNASLTIESGSNVDTSDSAAATDSASASVVMTGADTGAGTEGAVITRQDQSSDAGAVTDAGNNVGAQLSSSDTAAATDAGAQPAVAVPVTDSGAAADAATISRQDTATESIVFGEGVPAIGVAVPVTDTAAATDAGAIAAAQSAQDAISGASDAGALSTVIPGAESATLSELSALTAILDATESVVAEDDGSADTGSTTPEASDTITATDSASVTAATITAGDNFTLSETSTPGTPIASTDSAAATDAALLNKSIVTADAGALTDAGQTLDIVTDAPFDEGNAEDASAPVAQLSSSDSGAAADAGDGISATASGAADSAAATDAASLTMAAASSDSAALSDSSNADKGAANLFADNFNAGNTSAWTGELVSGAGSVLEVIAGAANEGGYGLRSYKPNGANNGAVGVYKTGITSSTGLWSVRFKVKLITANYGGGLWLITAEHPTNGRTFNVHHWNDDGQGWRVACRNKDGTESNIMLGALSTGTWYDFEVVYDESGAQPVTRVYLDGVLSGTHTDTSSGGSSLTPSDLYLRPFEQSWTNSWDIHFDLVSVADGFQQSNTNASKESSDAGAVTDAATISRLDASSDSAEATDAASLSMAAASSDSAEAFDLSSEPGLSGSDFSSSDNAAADDVSAPAVAFSSTDSAAATDAGALVVANAGIDDADAEDFSDVAVQLSSSDTAAATDAGAFGTPLAGSDTASIVEGSQVLALFTGADSGAAADASALPSAVSSSDSATATESASIAVTFSSVDVSVVTDAGAPAVTLSSSDSGAAADASTPAVTLSSADALSAVDVAAVFGYLNDSDMAAVLDLAPPGSAVVAYLVVADQAAIADAVLSLFTGQASFDYAMTAVIVPAAKMAGTVDGPGGYLVAVVAPAAKMAATVTRAGENT